MTKTLPKVLDRNGNEIKVGDRVKVIADEVNAFMKDWYEEDWTTDMEVKEDLYGTAVVNKFFQLVADDGEMIYDLDVCSNGKNEELEIVAKENAI